MVILVVGMVVVAAFTPSNFICAYVLFCLFERLWNYKASRQLGQLTGHRQRVTCLTSLGYLGNGPYIATGSSDCSIKMFDVAIGKAVNKMIMRAKSKCTGLAAINGGSSIVSGHMDGSLRLVAL